MQAINCFNYVGKPFFYRAEIYVEIFQNKDPILTQPFVLPLAFPCIFMIWEITVIFLALALVGLLVHCIEVLEFLLKFKIADFQSTQFT